MTTPKELRATARAHDLRSVPENLRAALESAADRIERLEQLQQSGDDALTVACGALRSANKDAAYFRGIVDRILKVRFDATGDTETHDLATLPERIAADFARLTAIEAAVVAALPWMESEGPNSAARLDAIRAALASPPRAATLDGDAEGRATITLPAIPTDAADEAIVDALVNEKTRGAKTMPIAPTPSTTTSGGGGEVCDKCRKPHHAGAPATLRCLRDNHHEREGYGRASATTPAPLASAREGEKE